MSALRAAFLAGHESGGSNSPFSPGSLSRVSGNPAQFPGQACLLGLPRQAPHPGNVG